MEWHLGPREVVAALIGVMIVLDWAGQRYL